MLDLKNSLRSKQSNMYSVQQASLLARRSMLQRLSAASQEPKPANPAKEK